MFKFEFFYENGQSFSVNDVRSIQYHSPEGMVDLANDQIINQCLPPFSEYYLFGENFTSTVSGNGLMQIKATKTV